MLSTLEQFHRQRGYGRVNLIFDQNGLVRHGEEGSAKARVLPGGKQAVLLNTGGGLAGGDDFAFNIHVKAGAHITVASQTAERIYRSMGATAHVATTLQVDDDATLFWLPQETIFYDGGMLHRRLSVNLGRNANLVALEPVIFGRSASNETITQIEFRDRWRVNSDDRLIFADDTVIGPTLQRSTATLNDNTAMATLLCAGDVFESAVPKINAAFGEHGAASFWNGKLVARLLAKDGYTLRKLLISALGSVVKTDSLPLNWTC